MRLAIVTLGLLALVSLSGEALAGEQGNLYICRPITTPPRIDGVIDADEWSVTDVSDDLMMTSSDAPAPVSTRFRVGYDTAKLYVAITCQETSPDKILANIRAHDGPVWTDDCVEFAVDPPHGHSQLIKFMVNSLGVMNDMDSAGTRWNSSAQVAAARGKDSWSVELAIPFADLGRKTPTHGEAWGMNVFRERYASGKPELLNWANAGGIFTISSHLGHIAFVQHPSRSLDLTALHKGMGFDLTPDLARHPNFEGKPWGLDDIRLAQEQDLSSSYETPHIAMAGPLPNRRLRALAFVRLDMADQTLSVAGTRLRDFPELSQRFPIDFTGVFVTNDGVWGGKGGERRLRALLTESYDLYVFARCAPKDIPAYASEAVLSAADNHAGILFYGAPADWLRENGKPTQTPEDIPASFSVAGLGAYPLLLNAGVSGVTDGAYPLISAFSVNGGRAIAIQERGDARSLAPWLAFGRENLIDYEYWIGLTGTAMMWLAGQQAIHLSCPTPGEVRFGQKSVTLPVAVRWEHNVTGDLGIEVFLRNEDGVRRKVYGKHFTAKPRLDLNVPISRLPYGRYFIEARAWRGKRIEAFAAARFTVTGPDHIPSFQLSSDFFERNTPATGTFECAGLAGRRVRTELVTNDGRVLARKDLGYLKDGPAEFALRVPSDTTIAMRARVSVLDGKGLVQAKSVDFTVPDRRRDTFNFIMWEAPEDVLAPYALDSMASAGFNVDLRWDMRPAISASGYSFMPYTTRITATRDDKGVMIPGCWNDEAFISKHVSDIAQKQLPARKHGVYVYSLGDENDTAGCCLHPACMAAYREFLKNSYGSIDALNASWGEHYTSFDDVQLMEGDDYFTNSAAFKAGKYPRWLDRNIFARLNYTKLCARFAAEYRKIDPLAITGFEGAGRYTDDIDAIYDTVGMWTTYGSVIDEIIGVTKPQELIHGNWIGYSKDSSTLITIAWRALCTGANSFWWWRWEGIGSYRGFVRPTLDLWPATHELTREMKIVRDGLGALMMDARPEHDGVAVFYSVESALADQLPAASVNMGPGEVGHFGVVHMLKDAGIQFTYVTPRRIASGALNGIKVLLLPKTLALDADSARAIREFVRSGGTLIADVRPAIYDEHLKALNHGLLDPVFAAGHPGSGKALILGRSFSEYESVRNQPEAVGLRQPVVDECIRSGVARRALVKPTDGKPSLMTEFSAWKLGSANIVALRKDLHTSDWTLYCPPVPSDKHSVRVDLPKPKVVYDLRAGRCLGKVSSFKADLRTGYANFYGLFDAPIAKPSLSVSQPTANLHRLDLIVRIPNAATAVRVDLIDPSGKKAAWAHRVLRVANGVTECNWQLPVDQPGKWTVHVTELFSGTTVSAK